MSFTDQYKLWMDADPAPVPEHALPNHTVLWLATNFEQLGPGKKFKVIGSLAVVAFFYLLRVGEYTPAKRSATKRTIPLRKCDIQLRRNGTLIPHSSPLDVLLTADAANICLENQKNGDRSSNVNHSATTNPHFCPVRSLARLIHELRDLDDSAALGSFCDNGTWQHVSADHMLGAVRLAAIHTRLVEDYGFDLKRIGTHSLRSGGATQLAANGYSADVIQALGRWKSDSYKRYIQHVMSVLTVGISNNMANLSFHHNTAAS